MNCRYIKLVAGFCCWWLLLLPVLLGCSLIGSWNEVGGSSTVCQNASGKALVGMGQQSATSFIYNSTASDPLVLCEVKGATITSVKNISGYTFSVAHGEVGSPFIILEPDATTSAFNGLPVAGNWSAQYAGVIVDRPSQLTVQVEWMRP